MSPFQDLLSGDGAIKKLLKSSKIVNSIDTPIYSCTSEKKNLQRMGPRYYFSPLFRLSNEPKNKKVQRAVFEKIRFEGFSLLKDGRKLEQNH